MIAVLDRLAISDTERASLTWLTGFEAHTVENIAAVIIEPGRAWEGGQVAWSRLLTEVPPRGRSPGHR
jgi:hypothetical protein